MAPRSLRSFRPTAGVAAVAVALAACTPDEGAPPPPTPSVAVTTTVAATSTSSTIAATSTSSTSSTTTTTTTIPGADIVAATCTTLRTGAWSARRAAQMANTPVYAAAGGAGALVDAVATACPDEVARIAAAVALEDRLRLMTRAILDARVGDASELGIESCADGMFVPRVTNVTGEPIGFLAGARRPDPTGPADALDEALVVWHVSPGRTRRVYFAGDTTDGCLGQVSYFAADRSPVDAAATDAVGPATTGDDPTTWLPALYGVADAPWTATPTEDGYHAAVDVRLLRSDTLPAADDPHPITAVTVCPGPLDRADADHVAVAFRVEFGPVAADPVSHPAIASLLYGAFRRGSDGRWRFLADPLPLTGAVTAADCGPVIPHP